MTTSAPIPLDQLAKRGATYLLLVSGDPSASATLPIECETVPTTVGREFENLASTQRLCVSSPVLAEGDVVKVTWNVLSSERGAVCLTTTSRLASEYVRLALPPQLAHLPVTTNLLKVCGGVMTFGK